MNPRFIPLLIPFILSINIGFSQYRSIDGFGNNVENPEWGSIGDEMPQLTSYGFEDGISEIGGTGRMNPREISNQLFAQEGIISDDKNLSDFVWAFGQFIDHDLTLVHNNSREPLTISIPTDDQVFDPAGAPISMSRSLAMDGSGQDGVPRTYANDVTAYIDASNVYGSDEVRANWLRTFTGGKLKTSFNNLLPWNTVDGEFNSSTDFRAPQMDDPLGLSTKHFVAGDVRANENPVLAALHTIFVREHNRIAAELSAENPDWNDETLYQEARRWVMAYMQHIVYEEWLPVMGVQLPAYRGYRPEINVQLSNEFSAAAFRMGHTLINSNLIRLKEGGEEIGAGSIGLRDAFFNPLVVSLVGDIDPYLRGMASQVQQKMDCKVIDDVRNFLFGGPTSGGMDLAAININRGRERGLPDFNTIRGDIGLPRVTSFEEISQDPDNQQGLANIYGSVDDIDPWVGMLAEDYMPGAMFGQTIMTIMELQFQRLRDGDRFYYDQEHLFSPEELSKIKRTTLRDIIMRNTDIEIMQDNVFKAIDAETLEDGPELDEIAMNALLHPNVVADETSTLSIYVDEPSMVDVSIYNNLGARVHSYEASLSAGTNRLELDFSAFADNTAYNILISRGEFEYTIVRAIKI